MATADPGARRLAPLALGLCLLGGVGLRLIGIADPPFEFHPTRQFRGAILARSLYWERLDSAQPWQRQVARTWLSAGLAKEPPIMEALAATSYLVSGGEHLWIPRVMAALLWAGGAVVLFRIAVRLFGPQGALLAPVCFMFLPFGVRLGRAFMPEALMTVTFLAAVLMILRYEERRTWGRLLGAAAVAALAVLTKFVVIFPLCGAFLALALRRTKLERVAFDLRTHVFLAVSAAPGIVYYAVVMAHSPALRGVLGSNLIPRLLLTSFFWKGWLTQIGRVTGWVPFALGTAALCFLTGGGVRALLAGLLAGNAFYAVIYAYATATHDYYHTAFFAVMMIALGRFGPALSFAASAARGRLARALAIGAMAVAGAGLLFFALAAADPALLGKETKTRLALPAAVFAGNQLTSWTPRAPDDLPEKARAIGESVGHSVRTIFLAHEYGFPLSYYGGIYGAYWPDTREDWARGLRGVTPPGDAERLARLRTTVDADFFIVEDMTEWARHAALQALLRARFRVLEENAGFIIFDLRDDRAPERRGGA